MEIYKTPLEQIKQIKKVLKTFKDPLQENLTIVTVSWTDNDKTKNITGRQWTNGETKLMEFTKLEVPEVSNQNYNTAYPQADLNKMSVGFAGPGTTYSPGISPIPTVTPSIQHWGNPIFKSNEFNIPYKEITTKDNVTITWLLQPGSEFRYYGT